MNRKHNKIQIQIQIQIRIQFLFRNYVIWFFFVSNPYHVVLIRQSPGERGALWDRTGTIEEVNKEGDDGHGHDINDGHGHGHNGDDNRII